MSCHVWARPGRQRSGGDRGAAQLLGSDPIVANPSLARNTPKLGYCTRRHFSLNGFNGHDLAIERGAPVRMRVARQPGQKSVKCITRISLVDSLTQIRDGLGAGSPSVGFSWYVGI